MLVRSLHIGEAMVVGSSITLVIDVGGGKARLGFQANPDVSILPLSRVRERVPQECEAHRVFDDVARTHYSPGSPEAMRRRIREMFAAEFTVLTGLRRIFTADHLDWPALTKILEDPIVQELIMRDSGANDETE